jgi:hypothetical protein
MNAIVQPADCSPRQVYFRDGSFSARSHEVCCTSADAGSGCWPSAAEPFVETDAAEARLAQRHKRVFLDPAAEVSRARREHRTRDEGDEAASVGDLCSTL